MSSIKIISITLIATGVMLVLLASAMIIFWMRANGMSLVTGLVLPATLTGALIALRLVSLKHKKF
jgi:hypothetical protein